MAAGLGFKDFTTGEVLTAADVDGYLMQGIWVFASAAARDAAVTSPQEGNACYLKDTNQVLTYSGSAWVAVGGGSPLTTKGDVYGFSTVDARIPIGANNTVLTADSTQALGLKWAAPAAGGAYTLINTGGTTLTGSSVTIGSIPGTYKDLYLQVSNYLPGSAALLQMRYNGSSTANTYYHIQGTVFGSVLANTAFNQDQCRLGAMEQNTSTSYSLFQHTIFDYANTNIWKHSWGTFTTNGTANSALFNWAPMANIWSNTGAITSIELFPNTGTFTSGTAYLYGVK
jgi:hypothetical protein